MEEVRVAFVGSGGIAKAHAFALAALPHYYENTPKVVRVAVTSESVESREKFAERYGFAEASCPSALWHRTDIDTIFILGPNLTHYTHLKQSLEMKRVERIYVEKPVCASREEADGIKRLIPEISPAKTVMVGFQFLQMSSVRHAMQLWQSGKFGEPLHFHVRYLHSGYLDPSYRSRRRNRLISSPSGGAVADLGSHALSLLAAFLGEGLQVVEARQSGSFPDVPRQSDLCTVVLLQDSQSGAAGTMVASRVSIGSHDLLEIELRATKGALRLSSERANLLEVYRAKGDGASWEVVSCGSDYLPSSVFPSMHVPDGWLRSLIHAHYLLVGGVDTASFVPKLSHGVTVHQLVCDIADCLSRTG